MGENTAVVMELLLTSQVVLFLQCGGQPGHHNHDMDRALLSVLLQRIQTCGSHGDYGLQNAGPGHCQVRKHFEL